MERHYIKYIFNLFTYSIYILMNSDPILGVNIGVNIGHNLF